MAAGTGNRRVEDIIEYGSTLSKFYDHVVITDTDRRGKPPGEVADLVKQGLVNGGHPENEITIVLEGREATQVALDMAEKGDIVVLQADDVDAVIHDVMEYKKKRSLSLVKEKPAPKNDIEKLED